MRYFLSLLISDLVQDIERVVLFEIIFLPHWGIGVPMVLFDELSYHEFILLS